MDTENLIKHSRARFEHSAAKRALKEKYQGKFLFAHVGGMWQAGPKLLNLLKCCAGTAIILDLYENPIQVDTNELYQLAVTHWQQHMLAWMTEYQELNKNR